MGDRVAYNLTEAAEVMGVSKRFFREQVLPDLAVVRLGRRVLVPRRSLEQYLDSRAEVT
jgi:excisionase family DNA binding protein